MCKEGNSWDDTISNECQTLWKIWYQSAQKVLNIVIPRCFIENESPVRYELIGFRDASEKVYSAVIYLRVNYKMITKNLYPVRS